jgi:hypothetical protein
MVPIATSHPDFGAVESSDIAFCGPESVANFVRWCQTWVKKLHWFRGQILDNLPSPALDGDREWVSEYIESATPKTVADHCRQQLHEFGIIDIPQSLDCSDEDVDPYTLEYCQRVERLLSWATGQCRAQFSQPPRKPAPTADRGSTPDPAAEEPQRPRVDGVEGGCWLWWQGSRHNIPKGNVYKLVAFMWEQDSASYDALGGPVFEDPVQPQTIRSLANKVNVALKKVGVPWRLSTDSTLRQLTKHRTKETGQSPRT